MTSRGRRDELRADFAALLVREQRRNVIDVGAGPGGDAPVFRDAGIDYVGVDLSVVNAEVAHRLGRSVIPGSLYAPPFRLAAFDAGWTMSTLVHVPDSRFDEAMSATTALLRPGSPLAVGLWAGVDREYVNETDRFDPPRFFSTRSSDRVREMLGGHGTIEAFETWQNERSDQTYQLAIVRV